MISIHAGWSRTEILAFIPRQDDLWEELRPSPAQPDPKNCVPPENIEVSSNPFKHGTEAACRKKWGPVRKNRRPSPTRKMWRPDPSVLEINPAIWQSILQSGPCRHPKRDITEQDTLPSTYGNFRKCVFDCVMRFCSEYI